MFLLRDLEGRQSEPSTSRGFCFRGIEGSLPSLYDVPCRVSVSRGIDSRSLSHTGHAPKISVRRRTDRQGGGSQERGRVHARHE